MPSSRLFTSRRTTIALVLSAPLTLAACELDPPSTTPLDAPSPRPVPDAEVAASARGAILLMVASLEAAVTTHRRLGPFLDPWLTLHAAHLGVLDDGSEDESVTAQRPVGKAAAVRERLLAQEADLGRRLGDAAMEAASGDLARALASMSAALSQQALL